MVDQESREIIEPPNVFAPAIQPDSQDLSESNQSSESVLQSKPADTLESISPTPARSNTQSNFSYSDAGILFSKAIQKYNQKNYSAAAEDFLFAYSQTKDTGLKARCLYWTGKCHYHNRQWDQSIQCFSRVESQFPTHTIVPNALLYKGDSYIYAGQINQGKQALIDLIQAYPQSNAASTARERLNELGFQQ